MLTRCSGVDIFATGYLLYTTQKSKGMFLCELDDFTFQLITGYSRLLVCGVIIFHIENPGDLFANRFMALSSDFGLTGHITGRPTHWMYYCLKAFSFLHQGR